MKTKTKQTTRTGTESEKWTLHGRFSVGRERGRMGGKVQEIRSIIGRQKIGRLRTAMEKEKPMNLCLKPMDMN